VAPVVLTSKLHPPRHFNFLFMYDQAFVFIQRLVQESSIDFIVIPTESPTGKAGKAGGIKASKGKAGAPKSSPGKAKKSKGKAGAKTSKQSTSQPAPTAIGNLSGPPATELPTVGGGKAESGGKSKTKARGKSKTNPPTTVKGKAGSKAPKSDGKAGSKAPKSSPTTEPTLSPTSISGFDVQALVADARSSAVVELPGIRAVLLAALVVGLLTFYY